MEYFANFSKLDYIFLACKWPKRECVTTWNNRALFMYLGKSLFSRCMGQTLSANQIARFLKLVYFLNRSTVFCIVLHDGKKPLRKETYALVVIGCMICFRKVGPARHCWAIVDSWHNEV